VTLCSVSFLRPSTAPDTAAARIAILIDLVDELPPAQGEELAQRTRLNDPRTIWTGDSETDCVRQCQPLKEASIPYPISGGFLNGVVLTGVFCPRLDR
jgi:hypothetical protein